MNPLGRLEDLPADYREALTRQNLVPLWPSLRALLPPLEPQPKTRATHWSYAALRPLLLRAGELTPIEKAERRVLVLANPDTDWKRYKPARRSTSAYSCCCRANGHRRTRHTPNAVHMAVEGVGAWTTVDGEKCPMQRGDLVPTPVF